MKKRQITDTVLMVRPAHFGFNPQTAENNAFQSAETQLSAAEIQILAVQEFDQFVQKLREAKIRAIVVQDSEQPIKYDAVFPNNWFSTHENGMIITYPVFAPMRRLERREEILTAIADEFQHHRRIHLEERERKQLFLEGTGSLILDRPNHIAYACRSVRTSEQVIDYFCEHMNYEKVLFTATDAAGQDIYHTNVMMALGEDFVVICMESVENEEDRRILEQKFAASQKEIIEISLEQVSAFAGNMLQVRNREGDTFLVMSEQAYRSLDDVQKAQIARYTNILYSPLYTIEQFGGGSARCMMAEIFSREEGED
ncbi:MAG: arginine deiminase-related protein [Bacteroidota bacterium]